MLALTAVAAAGLVVVLLLAELEVVVVSMEISVDEGSMSAMPGGKEKRGRKKKVRKE